MPFDSKSASEAGKRSKRGPVKKELPSIKEKDGNFIWKSVGWFSVV